MGMSANANLAWGVDLGEDSEMESDLDEKIEAILDTDWDLTDFFGLGEPPWRDDRWAVMPQEEREALRTEWNERERIEVPVEFTHYGHCDYSVRCLVVKRTHHRVNWGCEPIEDMAKFQPPIPGGAEVAALNQVLDAIGFEGDRTPKLLLFAYYG